MSKPRLAAALAVAALAFTALPVRAHALEPQVSAEMVAGGQDVPDALFLGLQPRLVLRLDRDAVLTGYVRAGAALSLVADENGADGMGLDAAGGADVRACKSAWSLCAGVRLGVGLQYADYDAVDDNSDTDDHAITTNAFVEAQPYLSWHGVSLGVDARAHRTLTLRDGDQNGSPGLHERDDDRIRYALGVSLGYRF
jgi:hypothetical protein